MFEGVLLSTREILKTRLSAAPAGDERDAPIDMISHPEPEIDFPDKKREKKTSSSLLSPSTSRHHGCSEKDSQVCVGQKSHFHARQSPVRRNQETQSCGNLLTVGYRKQNQDKTEKGKEAKKDDLVKEA